MQTLEAIIDKNGTVKVLGDVRLPESRRALLTILDEEPRLPTESRKEQLFSAFGKLAEKDIFPSIEDPVAWQRKLRDERE